MGIDLATAELLVNARRLGVDYSRALTIGRQSLYLDPTQLGRVLERAGVSPDGGAGTLVASGYAEPLLAALGAEEAESMDASPYEGATLIHDLNAPVPESLRERFSVVIDSGSLEHVFDIATALANLTRLVAPGGHLIGAYPANNQLGHGLYQFSPELFFRALDQENGFELLRMYLIERRLRPVWYRVTDPKALGHRVLLRNRAVTEIAFVARRTADEIGELRVTQSDYATAWASEPRARSGPRGALARIVPDVVRRLYVRAALLRASRRSRSWLRRVDPYDD